VTELASELGLRLLKVVLASVLGAIVYLVLVGPLGVAGSPQLALESWIAGALLVLLLESSPF
jgi:hypothetical protein